MFSLRVHSLDTNHPVSLEAAEFTTISAAKSYSAVVAARSNPRFSERRGIAHLFRRRRSITTATSLPSHGGASTLLFVVAVPNYLSFNDFIRFCEPRLDHVAELVFIRNDAMEDRYSVVVRFTNEMKADEFYGSFNGMKYSPSEAEVCHILFLESVEYIESDQIAGTPPDECTQLPICPVCLERLDSESSGIATTLCDHSFPCPCTSKWTHLSCQVCRLCHERDNTPACSVCGLTENPWVCVICGFVGCGRYKEGQHAVRHYEDTKHCYSLDLKSQQIWDYEGDAYVHRLNQSKIDGKLGTDVNSECRVLGGDCEGCECSEESGISGALYSSEVENIADEYNRLLASQLETQRQFYESLLMEARSKTDNLVSEAVEKAVNLRIHDIQSKLEKASQEKKAAEDKHQTLIEDQQTLSAKYKETKEREALTTRQRDEKIFDLEEQVGTITLLALTGLLVFMLFFMAATINAVVIALLLSLAVAGGFFALFFTCVGAVYIGALSVAIFVISTITISAIVAALITTGWVGFFWCVWMASKKSLNLAKHSLSVTGSTISAYSYGRHAHHPQSEENTSG